ncbi:MAG: hypothetical protein H6Q87_2071 [candidate division NC10 bacterium]|nr:hypothetical protein [candidate division NC10 bacterium]
MHRALKLRAEGRGVQIEKGGVFVQEAHEIQGVGEELVVVRLEHLHETERHLAFEGGLFRGQCPLFSAPSEGLTDAQRGIHVGGTSQSPFRRRTARPKTPERPNRVHPSIRVGG